MSEKKPAMRVRENDSVSEAYVNKVIGFMFDGASLCLTLGVARSTPEKVGEGAPPPAVPAVHVTHRIAMPPSTAVELHGMIDAFVKAMSRPANPKQAN